MKGSFDSREQKGIIVFYNLINTLKRLKALPQQTDTAETVANIYNTYPDYVRHTITRHIIWSFYYD